MQQLLTLKTYFSLSSYSFSLISSDLKRCAKFTYPGKIDRGSLAWMRQIRPDFHRLNPCSRAASGGWTRSAGARCLSEVPSEQHGQGDRNVGDRDSLLHRLQPDLRRKEAADAVLKV